MVSITSLLVGLTLLHQTPYAEAPYALSFVADTLGYRACPELVSEVRTKVSDYDYVELNVDTVMFRYLEYIYIDFFATRATVPA